jgi:hypothetical protein
MLIGYIGLGRDELNVLLGACIDVSDVFTVRRGQLFEFADPIPDGLNTPPHVLLSGKWVQDERSEAGFIAIPEVLMRGRLQRFLPAAVPDGEVDAD